MFRPLWATLTMLAAGAATWIGAAIASGAREAWDSGLYFAALPMIGLTAGIVSYFAPARFWRWAFLPFLAQAVIMTAQSSAGGAGLALLPLGLIIFFTLGAFCVIPAAIGSVAGRKAAAR